MKSGAVFPSWGMNNNQVQPLDNSNDDNHQFDTIDGKKVLREYSIHGKQNAFHLLTKTPSEKIFDYLKSLNIDAD